VKALFFWGGVCLLAIPAIVGTVVGIVALSLVCMAAAILCALLVGAGAILVLPVFVWCAYMDPTDWKLTKAFAKRGVDSLN
jgi:hypothetical protein